MEELSLCLAVARAELDMMRCWTLCVIGYPFSPSERIHSALLCSQKRVGGNVTQQ